MKTISQTQQDLEDIVTQSKEREEQLEIWEPGYVHKQAWTKDGATPRVTAATENSKQWDTGPKF